MSEHFGTSDYHFNKICETTGQLEEYVHSLLAARERLGADRDALVRYVRVTGDNPKEVPHTHSKNFNERWDDFIDQYVEWQKSKIKAYEALSQELKDEIRRRQC